MVSLINLEGWKFSLGKDVCLFFGLLRTCKPDFVWYKSSSSAVSESAWLGILGDYSLHFVVKFDLI